MLPSREVELRYFIAADGSSPFENWFVSVEPVAKAKLTVALARLEQGNTSNLKSVGEGVIELCIHFGPGYRIYLGRDG